MHQGTVQEDSNFSHYYDYTYNESLIPFELDLPHEPVISTVCYIIIICISFPGNVFLLWVLKQEGLKSSADWLLLHLTASDLLFTLMLIPWTIDQTHGWVFGVMGCKLFTWFTVLGLYSYMMFLMVMTVHRYVVIVHPTFATSVRNRFRLYTHVSSALAWLMSTGFSLPEALYTEIEDRPKGVFCVLNYDSGITANLVIFINIIPFFTLPFVVITFCYARIGFAIRTSHRRNRHNAVCTFFCVVVGFFICWAPFNIFLFLVILKSFDVPALMAWEIGEDWKIVYFISDILASSHCCVNPLILIFGGKKFRRYLSLFSQRYRRNSFSTQSSFTVQTHL